MGYYSDYLSSGMNFNQLEKERKIQLKKISDFFNNSDILVYAADLMKRAPVSIDYTDILAFEDQLSSITSETLVVILETPGGFGEVVEDLVSLIRKKYKKLIVIIPGYAKSAGTIFAMSADEIYMGVTSALGPIDAQIQVNGKQFSADELLDQFKSISDEIKETGRLNPIYIPILQNLSLGELKRCTNAQEFSKKLVAKWLEKYKFSSWTTHDDGTEVTDEEKKNRANDIATKLRENATWLTHGKSIRIEDLQEMKLQINNYDSITQLVEPINKYYALMRISFDANVYKIIETINSQIYRLIATGAIPKPQQNGIPIAEIDFICPKCATHHKIQANLGNKADLKPGNKPFPKNNVFKCEVCSTESNLINLRRQIEAQTNKKIV